MHRLFVAIRPPESARRRLLAMMGGVAGARWQDEDQLHLTLRFIGEVESWRAQEVDDALANIRARPFELSLRGLGTFERGGKIAALWVGVEKTEGLAHLQNKVETALQRVGLEPERRRFAPHVTLARTDKAPPEKLIQHVQAHNLFRATPMPVESFTLYSSRLGKEQAVYVPEVEYDLLAAAAA